MSPEQTHLQAAYISEMNTIWGVVRETCMKTLRQHAESMNMTKAEVEECFEGINLHQTIAEGIVHTRLAAIESEERSAEATEVPASKTSKTPVADMMQQFASAFVNEEEEEDGTLFTREPLDIVKPKNPFKSIDSPTWKERGL